MRILSLQTNFDALSESMRVLALLLFTTLTFPLGGQDAANVNSKIVRVEFENQKVRILRARYAPHERLEMHSHPAKAEVQIGFPLEYRSKLTILWSSKDALCIHHEDHRETNTVSALPHLWRQAGREM
jgi:hypothetical protein